MKKYYVYNLVSSKDDNIFYVGKGSGNRMYKHVKITCSNYKSRSKNPKLYNKIDSILNEGYKVLPKIIFESFDEKECLDYEIKKIKEIGINNLCNLTNGGDGHSKIVSDETKKKISESMKGRTSNFKGKKLSNESKLKMSLSHIDKKFSMEHRQNLSKSLRGRNLSDDHKKKIKDTLMKRRDT